MYASSGGRSAGWVVCIACNKTLSPGAAASSVRATRVLRPPADAEVAEGKVGHPGAEHRRRDGDGPLPRRCGCEGDSQQAEGEHDEQHAARREAQPVAGHAATVAPSGRPTGGQCLNGWRDAIDAVTCASWLAPEPPADLRSKRAASESLTDWWFALPRGYERNSTVADLLADDDRHLFVAILGDVVERFKWECRAYCLMTNHYHLALRTPEANIGAGMHRLNGLYAQAFNRRHGFKGHLFEERYWSGLIETDEHVFNLMRYVVLNPVRAGMCGHCRTNGRGRATALRLALMRLRRSSTCGG